MKRYYLALMMIFFLTNLSLAETIYLKDGRKIEGTITRQTDELIKVDVYGVELTYYRDEISQIIGDTEAFQPTRERKQPLSPGLLPTTRQKPYSLPESTFESYSPGSESSDYDSRDKSDVVRDVMDATGVKESVTNTLRKIIQNAPAEDANKLQQAIDVNEMLDELVPVYEKYFTEQELRDLANFYRSSAGKKLLKATPLILQDSVAAIFSYVQRKGQGL